MFVPLIMAGGAGTRFWPASRRTFPKQYLSIISENSLLRETIDRLGDLTAKDLIHISTTASQAELIQEHIPSFSRKNIIIEPALRDTAACIGLASFVLQKKFKGEAPVIGVFPADHVIRDSDIFINTVNAAWEMAGKEGVICQMGIKPAYPATGYGYIHRGEHIKKLNKVDIYNVAEFREKPDQKTAEKYVESGEYYWNSGIFIFSPETMIQEMETHLPDVYEGLKRIADSDQKLLNELYPELQKISIDYGVIERTDKRCVAEALYHWDDVGSWEAVEKYFDRDPEGNSVKGEFIGENCEGCIIYNSSNTAVAATGLKDMIIVVVDDALMVCPKSKAQDVKKIVTRLKEEGRRDLL